MAHRRARRVRRSRHALTLEAFGALSLGPADDQIDVLRPIYLEHKERFGPDSWAVRFYEHRIDDRVHSGPANAVELEPHELPPGCDAPAM